MLLRTSTHYDYLDKAKIFLETAAKRFAVLHLWFHPSEPTSLFENEFRRILQYIDSQRKAGLVWIATMGEIAAYCEAREQLQPVVERSTGDLKIVWKGAFQGEKYGHTELSLLLPPMPKPSRVTINDKHGCQHLEPGHSYVQTETEQILINMPTTAISLHITF
jgi:hypothetical protein